jgi:hypothetical protein
MGYDMTTLSSSGDEDKDYFRANIWGMGILRGAMKAGNVMDLDHDNPEWPDLEQSENETEGDYQARCDEAHEPIRSFRSTNPKLVPIGKFCSNDGWVIVPEECNLIADALDKVNSFHYKPFMGNEEFIEAGSENMIYVKEFAEYCRHAAKHGGFNVW